MTTTVTLRSRRRITLPAPIAAAASLCPGDALNVEWAGGRIVLTPISAASQTRQPMSRFLGAARGVYGDSAEEANNHLSEMREAW